MISLLKLYNISESIKDESSEVKILGFPTSLRPYSISSKLGLLGMLYDAISFMTNVDKCLSCSTFAVPDCTLLNLLSKDDSSMDD